MRSASTRLQQVLGRPLVAGLVLLLLYVAAASLVDPHGHLGTDTGAKVYTLEVMDRKGSAEPDIGYWAERRDPGGSLHPVYQTIARDDGSWVAVTTLPILQAARPLYAVGGYRATLLLPMLGSVGAAFATRAVARRLRPERAHWDVYWIVGLASPAVVYALDFWEHSIGLACMVGAVAAILAFVEDRRWFQAAGAGVLLGLGATVRNETFVYAVVMVGLAGLWSWYEQRSIRPPIRLGVLSVGGFSVPWAGNLVLERAVDGPSRASRATGTAARVGEQFRDRIADAVQTFVGLNAGEAFASAMLGLVVVAVVLAAFRAESRGDHRFAIVALGAVGLVYVFDAAGGLGFVPGLLLAFPLSIAGFVGAGRDNGSRYVVAVALLTLPLVWGFQFLGGAAAQWGGRYSLTSGVLLGVVGLTGGRVRFPTVTKGLVVLSAVVSALGVAWVIERSHGVDAFFDEVVAHSEDVVIARQAFLLREAGAEAVGRRWLSVASERDFARAVDVVRELDDERFTVLAWDADAPPPGALPADVVEVDRMSLRFIDTPVGLVTYRFTE